jgi:hypothetical protein
MASGVEGASAKLGAANVKVSAKSAIFFDLCI